jgi:hypothetical protein
MFIDFIDMTFGSKLAHSRRGSRGRAIDPADPDPDEQRISD